MTASTNICIYLLIVFLCLLSHSPSVLGAANKKQKTVYDPYEYFCGNVSCYDVLGLEMKANDEDIKKVSSCITLNIFSNLLEPGD